MSHPVSIIDNTYTRIFMECGCFDGNLWQHLGTKGSIKSVLKKVYHADLSHGIDGLAMWDYCAN